VAADVTGTPIDNTATVHGLHSSSPKPVVSNSSSVHITTPTPPTHAVTAGHHRRGIDTGLGADDERQRSPAKIWLGVCMLLALGALWIGLGRRRTTRR
jgi:hypothetical protein